MGAQPCAQLPLQKEIFGTSAQKIRNQPGKPGKVDNKNLFKKSEKSQGIYQENGFNQKVKKMSGNLKACSC